MDAPRTLQEAIKFFSSYENCRQFMVAVRWADGVVRCPHCNSEKVTYLSNARVYKCSVKHPLQKFSLKVGTIFEDSPLPLEKWLPAVWLIVSAKNGISSYEIHRALGVTQKSAWFMMHRIRLAMQSNSFVKLGGSDSGPVEVDETFVGGKPKNMHLAKRKKMQRAVDGRSGKVIVMGMLDRESRQVRARVVPNVKRETLQAEILDHIKHGSRVYTYGHWGYDKLAEQQYIHETVNHLQEYVRGQVHTQGIENFWSLLKRSLTGTYIAVEPFHLGKYVDEQVFRFNNRATKDNPLNDADRFTIAMNHVAGRRLTYAELTGKVGETAN
jgi:transposase-like protein